MKLHDIISINSKILEKLLSEEMKKVPGIDAKNIFSIKVDNDNCCINVSIKPTNIELNFYLIAKEVQQAISFYLSKQFDIDKNKIKININVTDTNG